MIAADLVNMKQHENQWSRKNAGPNISQPDAAKLLSAPHPFYVSSDRADAGAAVLCDGDGNGVVAEFGAPLSYSFCVCPVLFT
jgi:hypothetical protein